MDPVFSELSLVIIVTAVVSIFMKILKQPLILGYILAGLLVGPSALGLIHNTELFEAFSSLGITLLLFIIGLGMNAKELKQQSKVVLVIGLTSLLTITLVGFATATAFGFGKTEALITGLALFFSSTIIIVKILSDKKEQNRLHGQIAIGVILFEDIIATFALLFVVAGKDGGGFDGAELALLTAKATLLLIFLGICSTKVLPRVSRYMASNQELLFLFAIGWGFGIASLFERAGFSIEIGALFAGVALASSPYVQEISARLKPLRDFFIVLFFITLGEQMDIGNVSGSIVPAIVFSLIVIFLKPLVVTSVAGLLGYTKRVSFKAGINLSQISEFSIVLVVLAVNEGMVRSSLGSIITLVAIITIASSTYLMKYDEALFKKFDRLRLRMFEKDAVYKERRSPKKYQCLVLGYHHGGHEFMKTFEQMDKRYLVVDYDPEVIDILERQKVDYIYGDATDVELLHEAGAQDSKLIISTIEDHGSNMIIVNLLKEINPRVVFISHADNIAQAEELYNAGAMYVMLPHQIGSEKMSAFIKRVGLNKEEFAHQREKHIAYLEGIDSKIKAG